MTDDEVIVYRNIERRDEVSLFRLRNSPSNLEFFKNPSPVSAEDHARWFASRITDFRELQIVGALTDQLIGIVFLVPIDNDSASVSINVDSDYQSQGIGQVLLNLMLLRVELLSFSRIEALIHISNAKSISLFERCGFIFEEQVSDFFLRYVKLTSQNNLK